jgi:hypothetical protein
MQSLKSLITSLTLAIFLAVSLPGTALANESGTESGDDAAIVFDLVILRPAGLIATAAGSVVFVVALPFSLITGSVGKTFNALVAGPAEYTFWRTMGDEI